MKCPLTPPPAQTPHPDPLPPGPPPGLHDLWKTSRTTKNWRHYRQGTSHCSCLEHCFLLSELSPARPAVFTVRETHRVFTQKTRFDLNVHCCCGSWGWVDRERFGGQGFHTEDPPSKYGHQTRNGPGHIFDTTRQNFDAGVKNCDAALRV